MRHSDDPLITVDVLEVLQKAINQAEAIAKDHPTSKVLAKHAENLCKTRIVVRELLRTQKQLLACASWSATRRIAFACDARSIVEARRALSRAIP